MARRRMGSVLKYLFRITLKKNVARIANPEAKRSIGRGKVYASAAKDRQRKTMRLKVRKVDSSVAVA